MSELTRTDHRKADALRTLEIIPGVVANAEGSALIKLGDTHVLCSATVEERVPTWKKAHGGGWVTAEYAMLPRATKQRTRREGAGNQSGRSVEIQRLIGRSLRSVVDLNVLGERQIILDCDVMQADGGTRCAAISGAYVALALAVRHLQATNVLQRNPITAAVAAVSVGIVGSQRLLDLDYSEDSSAAVDCNVVMTEGKKFVELQATSESGLFDLADHLGMIELAEAGLLEIFAAQRDALKSV